MDVTEALAPLVLMDAREPLPFTDVAVSVLTPGDTSPSSGHVLDGPGDIVVEYALWGDLEIGHAYELEHVWVYADASARPLAVDGSAHGMRRALLAPAPGERVTVFSEPGKHGMAASTSTYALSRALLDTLCGAAAGSMGVHGAHAGADLDCSVSQFRQAWNLLRTLRFQPAWDAHVGVDARELRQATWAELDGSRHPRALAAIAGAPATPVQLPVGLWGSDAEGWIGTAVHANGALHMHGAPLEEAFAHAQQHARYLVVVTESANQSQAVRQAAWEAYASAHLLILTPEAAASRRPVSLAVPEHLAAGTTQVVASPEPRDDVLTIGPGGDFDCDLDLLHQHGWPGCAS